VWDTKTGVMIGILAGHGNEVSAAAFVSDGNHVTTASDDHTARLWDLSASQPVLSLKENGVAHSADISPDGTRIVTTSATATSGHLWGGRSGH
jgi:WD40 repeat protein